MKTANIRLCCFRLVNQHEPTHRVFAVHRATGRLVQVWFCEYHSQIMEQAR